MYSPRRRLVQGNLRQKLLLYGLIGIIGCMLAGFILTLGIFAWYSKDLPSPGKLSQSTASSTVFYDRDGKVIYEMYKDRNRVPVEIKDISLNLRRGTIAVEDKDFYKHSGISEKGILRAFLLRGSQGGSTITQQLIKNTLLDAQRTLPRKIKEVILAIEVERRYTKDQILEMYLNEAPYGGSFWGVESAARGYFGKHAKELNLVESAFLSGLPQSPSYYSPFIGKTTAWKGRTKDVLRRMREDGYITKAQEMKAVADVEKLKFNKAQFAITAPHFVFYIRDELEKEFGPKVLEQGLKVKTTLSLEVQQFAEKAVNEEIENLKDYDVGNGAAVILDSQTGEILAMVGSYDYNNEEYGKFNAALGSRQPGSSIKPITYALAFEKGYTPATVLMDVKTVFPNQGDKDYIPVNYDGKFRGPIQLRFALANSYNIPAVKLLAMVGVRDFLAKAEEFGLKGFSPTIENMNRYGLAITLGGGESTLLDMTSAFAVFARGGVRKDVSAISEVVDYNGKVIFKSVKPREKRVVSPEVSYLVSHILSDNVARTDAFGPNSYLRIPGKTVAVKTGTTDDKRDNWAIGYTKAVSVGVWVGNNDNTPMNPRIASGITGASPIWHTIMSELMKKYKDGIIDRPEKIKEVEIDSYLGGLPRDGATNKRKELFTEGAEPKDISLFYKKLRISKANGKLANEVEVRQGQYDNKEYIYFTENDPISSDGKNRWQEGIDSWMREQNNSNFPPTETSDASSDNIAVSITSPGDKTTVTSNTFDIKAKIGSLAEVTKTEIFINGNKIKELDGNREDLAESVNLSDGVYEIKVIVRNEKDKTSDSVVKIGVNKPWDVTPTPPSPTSP